MVLNLLSLLKNDVQAADFSGLLPKQLRDQSKKVAVLCRRGVRSSLVADWLRFVVLIDIVVVVVVVVNSSSCSVKGWKEAYSVTGGIEKVEEASSSAVEHKK